MDFCEVEVDVCDPGTFGADCENYCHCKHGVCNYTTGVCPPGGCLAGWKGANCDVECIYSVEYGPGCGGTCSARKCKEAGSPCPWNTGRCDGGCQPGWKGVDCTSECSHTYGYECNKSCSSRHCNGTASSTCDHVTGACDHGCSAGWKDVDCVTECTLNVNYGLGCHGNCSSRNCKEVSGTCPRDTGQCDGGCQPGWEGVDCTSECTLNVSYGPGCHGNCSSRKCKEVSGTCPRGTGQCDGGCQPGWWGVDCMLECQSRTFGVTCSSTCGHCVDNGPCHHVTGTCLKGCSPGWVSGTCRQECPPRTFGVNCSSTCGHCVDDKPCHHVTGTCLKGCSPGWVNDTCRQAANSSPETSTGRISPLAAGFIGAFAMLVIVVAVCLWRKGDFRMAKKSSTDCRTPETNPAPPVEVPTYDVLPEHDYTKLDRIHTEHYDTLKYTVDYQNSDVRI